MLKQSILLTTHACIVIMNIHRTCVCKDRTSRSKVIAKRMNFPRWNACHFGICHPWWIKIASIYNFKIVELPCSVLIFHFLPALLITCIQCVDIDIQYSTNKMKGKNIPIILALWLHKKPKLFRADFRFRSLLFCSLDHSAIKLKEKYSNNSVHENYMKTEIFGI